MLFKRSVDAARDAHAFRWAVAAIPLVMLVGTFGFPTTRGGEPRAASGSPAVGDQQRDLARRRAELKRLAAEHEAAMRKHAAEFGKRPANVLTPRRKADVEKRARDVEPRAAGQTRRGRGASDEVALAYKLKPGQKFAYRVEIEVQEGGRTERFLGTPVFRVRSIEDDGVAELAAVGRLSMSQFSTPERDGAENPARAVWLGTRIELAPKGKVHGREDFNAKSLPLSLDVLIKPKELVFLEVPGSSRGSFSQEGSAWLWVESSFFTIQAATIDGRLKEAVQSEPISSSVVRIRKERSFRSTKEPLAELKYLSTSRFDHQRGMLLDTEATYTEVDQGHESPTVKIHVKLLEGESFQSAFRQADRDWTKLPPELNPVEFTRVRLDSSFKYQRFDESRQLKPGQLVAHFNDHDYRWYLAEVVQVASERKVGIRYRGSKEELEVVPGELARPPASARGK